MTHPQAKWKRNKNKHLEPERAKLLRRIISIMLNGIEIAGHGLVLGEGVRPPPSHFLDGRVRVD